MKLKEKNKKKKRNEKEKKKEKKKKKGTGCFSVHAPNCFCTKEEFLQRNYSFFVNQKFLQEMMVID